MRNAVFAMSLSHHCKNRIFKTPFLVNRKRIEEAVECQFRHSMITIPFQNGIGISSSLPFVHALSAVHPQWLDDPQQVAERTLQNYYSLLEALGLLKEWGHSDLRSDSSEMELGKVRRKRFRL